MTREEAIETLLESNEMFKQQGFNRYLTTAIDKVCESPWISVKDELPKCNHTTDGGSFSDMCLCRTAADEYIPLALNEVCDEDEGLLYYWGTYNDVYDEEVDGEITHWMPIPPLKEED